MKRFFLAALLLLGAVAAHAEPSPCRFGAVGEEGTSVDIAALYKAADKVVTGEVIGRVDPTSPDLLFSVEKTLKGLAEKDIALHGQRPVNTEMNGFSLPGNRKLLLFLKVGTGGIYEAAEDYNSPCNILFLIQEDGVHFIEKDEHNAAFTVPSDKLQAYLEGAPAKLLYKYK